MKKVIFLFLFIVLTQSVSAQYRADLPGYFDYTGPLIDDRAPTIQNKLNRFFSSIKMQHTYNMSFNSFGGNYQNVNAYTNSMFFNFSEKITGRVDISFFHTPFSQNNQVMGGKNFQNKVSISNAELNFKLSENSYLRFQYQKFPNSYGYNNPYQYNRHRYRNNWMWY